MAAEDTIAALMDLVGYAAGRRHHEWLDFTRSGSGKMKLSEVPEKYLEEVKAILAAN